MNCISLTQLSKRLENDYGGKVDFSPLEDVENVKRLRSGKTYGGRKTYCKRKTIYGGGCDKLSLLVVIAVLSGMVYGTCVNIPSLGTSYDVIRLKIEHYFRGLALNSDYGGVTAALLAALQILRTSFTDMTGVISKLCDLVKEFWQMPNFPSQNVPVPANNGADREEEKRGGKSKKKQSNKRTRSNKRKTNRRRRGRRY